MKNYKPRFKVGDLVRLKLEYCIFQSDIMNFRYGVITKIISLNKCMDQCYIWWPRTSLRGTELCAALQLES